MDDTAAVGEGESAGHGHQHVEVPLQQVGRAKEHLHAILVAHQLGPGVALDQLEHDLWNVVFPADDVVNRHDVRVLETPGDARLPKQASDVTITAPIAAQRLDRDRAVQLELTPDADDGHAALSQGGADVDALHECRLRSR